MHIAAWFWLAAVVITTWGVVGLLQKISTNHLSAESALIWTVVGYFALLPWIYPSESIFSYSYKSLIWALSNALLNAVGNWALLAAMQHGGKASVVVPITALYPVVMILTSPIVLKESISVLQGVGVIFALAAVALLSS